MIDGCDGAFCPDGQIEQARCTCEKARPWMLLQQHY